MSVLLATWSGMPEGEYGGEQLILDQLAERGVDARWVVWDAPLVDWSTGPVVVRSTWDYESRLEEFLAWARAVPELLNGADAFAWNSDKAYLAELAEHGVAVVPTRVVDPGDEPSVAIAQFEDPVVKPRVGASGRGVTFAGQEVVTSASGYVVQPLMESVRTEGETSVFVLGGRAISQARKVPALGEIRVHDWFGGRTFGVEPTPEAIEVAEQAMAAAQRCLGRPLDYARVDQMRLPSGQLAVSELEAIEPGLYLDVMPENAAHFADFVAGLERSG